MSEPLAVPPEWVAVLTEKVGPDLDERWNFHLLASDDGLTCCRFAEDVIDTAKRHGLDVPDTVTISRSEVRLRRMVPMSNRLMDSDDMPLLAALVLAEPEAPFSGSGEAEG